MVGVMVKRAKAKARPTGRVWRPANRAAQQQKPVTRASAPKVLAQGVAKVNPRPFESDVTYDTRLALNATVPMHLPLPRPVAPYTVVRTTKRFSTSDHTVLIGAYEQNGNETYHQLGPQWTNVCAVSTAALAGTVGSESTDWTVHCMPGLGGPNDGGITCTPAAITVQVMNPNALQTTSGTVYGTVLRQMPEWHGNIQMTVQNFLDNLIQVNPPRLMSAGKLSLRGVEAHCPPGNMSKLADFRTPYNYVDGSTHQFNELGANKIWIKNAGFMPILIYNSQGNPLNLEFLVTMEWRVRFDPANIAAASHRQYPSAPLQVWDRVLQTANGIGHGVHDIAETVANVGQAVGQGIQAGRTVARVWRSARAPAQAAALLVE